MCLIGGICTPDISLVLRHEGIRRDIAHEIEAVHQLAEGAEVDQDLSATYCLHKHLRFLRRVGVRQRTEHF